MAQLPPRPATRIVVQAATRRTRGLEHDGRRPNDDQLKERWTMIGSLGEQSCPDHKNESAGGHCYTWGKGGGTCRGGATTEVTGGGCGARGNASPDPQLARNHSKISM
jgi:hypothetical protein